MNMLTLREIYLARQSVVSTCIKTPLVTSHPLGEISNSEIFLKLESMQPTGSYKVRGATNRLHNLSQEEHDRGVVAYSTGNHGLAVAYVASKLNIRAVICVSEKVSPERIKEIRRYDAEVKIHGADQDEAGRHAQSLHKEQGLTMVHPFDDPFVIAGQGTIGLELLEQVPDMDTVIVPLAGGGLLSGVALAVKSANPEIRVIGVSAEHSPSMVKSIAAGRPVEVNERRTIARSLEGGIGLANNYTFSLVKELADDVLSVSEKEIAEALVFMLFRQRQVVEGAAAVGVSALLSDQVKALGKKTVIVVSGGNLDAELLLQCVQQGADNTIIEHSA